MFKKYLTILIPVFIAGCSNHVWINDYANVAPKTGEKIVVGVLDAQLVTSSFWSTAPKTRLPDGVCFQPIEQNVEYMNGSICGSIKNWAIDRSYPPTSKEGYVFTTLKPGTYRISSFWFKGGISVQPREIRFTVPETGDGVSFGTLEFYVDLQKYAKKQSDAVTLRVSNSEEAVALIKLKHPNINIQQIFMDTSRAHEFIYTMRY